MQSAQSQTTATAVALADAAPRQLLRLAAAGEQFVVPIEAVREILEVGRLTAIPHTPSFVRGVMNLRGAVVPVIDLASRFGDATAAVGRRSCIVVVEAGDADAGLALLAGLLVDAVFEVMDIDATDIEAVPSLGTKVAPEFLAGMIRSRGVILGLLDLEHVLDVDDLTRRIESHRAS